MKFLLILVTFSQSPQGVYLQHVASFGAMHECVTFSELHNQLAESPDEVLACVKVDL
jgi:hypothetical protein